MSVDDLKTHKYLFEYADGSPMSYSDPTGLFNPAKGFSPLGNPTIAGFSAGSGGVKISIAVRLSPAATTGVGALPPATLACRNTEVCSATAGDWGCYESCAHIV